MLLIEALILLDDFNRAAQRIFCEHEKRVAVSLRAGDSAGSSVVMVNNLFPSLFLLFPIEGLFCFRCLVCGWSGSGLVDVNVIFTHLRW